MLGAGRGRKGEAGHKHNWRMQQCLCMLGLGNRPQRSKFRNSKTLHPVPAEVFVELDLTTGWVTISDDGR